MKLFPTLRVVLGFVVDGAAALGRSLLGIPRRIGKAIVVTTPPDLAACEDCDLPCHMRRVDLDACPIRLGLTGEYQKLNDSKGL